MTNEEYMTLFEKEVIIKGYEQGVFCKTPQEQIVPVDGGKLKDSKIGFFTGSAFEYRNLLAINYYGLFKMSSEIHRAVDKAEKIFGKIKTIMTPVVFYNAVKIEHVKDLAPDLLDYYPDFKRHLVELRWGKK